MVRPPLPSTAVLAVLAALWGSLTACSAETAEGADLVAPFQDAAARAYDDQGEDRSDPATAQRGIRPQGCFAVSDEGLQDIAEAITGQDGDVATDTVGTLSGPPQRESLFCALEQDGERVAGGLSVATTELEADELLDLQIGEAEDLGRDLEEKDGDVPSGLDEDDVVVSGSEDSSNAVWVNGGLLVAINLGDDYDADTALEALGVAVDAVEEQLGD